MAYTRKEIPAEAVSGQLAVCARIKSENEAAGLRPLAFVDTYGCQQNEADSESLRGYIAAMGFGFTDDKFGADLIVVNTCAVREHAEMRVLGNVGALNHAKARNPNLTVAVCGCMVQQPHMAEKIKRSYRVVDLVFGPHELWRFPELYDRARKHRGRVFETPPCDGVVAEGIPAVRQSSVKAWLPVMNGCNNFCTYCIVPYVRGRERSRRPEDVVRDARGLAAQGFREITLLGQNVNSYGRDLGPGGCDFPDLMRQINDIPGDFVLRFMTSHPRDATEKLFRAMAECEKIERHIHLPVQSGSNRVLKAMNRHYSREQYLALVDTARKLMPDIVLTTDIIVGFPGETEEEFGETLSLVEQVRYDAMFTFIYSPRVGTPAAGMPDPVSREEKQVWFDSLVSASNRISGEIHKSYEGRTLRVLIDGETGRDEYNLSSRTAGGRLVHLRADPSLVGSFADAKITSSNTWALYGEL